MGFLNHIRVLNIKIISQINLFLIFLKKTIDKYKFKLNFMCFSVALFYHFFTTFFYVENELSCVGKALAHLKIKGNFEEMSSIYLLIKHARDMALEWGVSGWFEDTLPYDVELSKSRLVSSWKYEYEIFELVKIYKTFDWKRNVMIYYGY